jgi:hypothetical protein
MTPRDLTKYDYRIVLEKPNGERLPLVSQGSDLIGARERLQEILDDPQLIFPKGWLERRPLDAWQTFCAAQTPRKVRSQ